MLLFMGVWQGVDMVHGLPNVLPGPAIPYTLRPPGGPPLKRPYRGGPPSGPLNTPRRTPMLLFDLHFRLLRFDKVIGS